MQAEKVAKERREKQEDTDYVTQREQIALFKEQEFQEYAKKVIAEESKTTQNLYPLLKVVQEGVGREREGINPDSRNVKLPYIGNTAQEMKLLNGHEYEATKGRLGFTW